MTVHDIVPRLFVSFEEECQHELTLAQRSVTYLATRGLDRRAVIACVNTEMLVDETIAAIRAHRTQSSYSTMDDDQALAESLRLEHRVGVAKEGTGLRCVGRPVRRAVTRSRGLSCEHQWGRLGSRAANMVHRKAGEWSRRSLSCYWLQGW